MTYVPDAQPQRNFSPRLGFPQITCEQLLTKCWETNTNTMFCCVSCSTVMIKQHYTEQIDFLNHLVFLKITENRFKRKQLQLRQRSNQRAQCVE